MNLSLSIRALLATPFLPVKFAKLPGPAARFVAALSGSRIFWWSGSKVPAIARRFCAKKIQLAAHL
jgi:hypothetical protein